MNKDKLKLIYDEHGKGEVLFRAIVERTQKRLYAVIRKMVGTHADADDILQDSYCKMYEQLDGFQWESQLETWAYRIAVNTALDFLRQNKKKAQVATVEQGNNSPNYERAERVLAEGLDQLPERQRAIFVMRYYEDMSFGDMAELTGISEGGLRSNYHHAKKKIKEIFIEKGLL